MKGLDFTVGGGRRSAFGLQQSPPCPLHALQPFRGDTPAPSRAAITDRPPALPLRRQQRSIAQCCRMWARCMISRLALRGAKLRLGSTVPSRPTVRRHTCRRGVRYGTTGAKNVWSEIPLPSRIFAQSLAEGFL